MASTRDSRILDWDTLLAWRARWRTEAKRVVWTNGCFDLVHAGHVRSLLAARGLGDVLVVGINSDDSVRRLKGTARPILSAAERAQVLAALECVDCVVVFDELVGARARARLRPDAHCTGPDSAPPPGKPIPAAAVGAAYGGRIEFLPLVGSTSTSTIIRRIREHVGACP